MQLNARRLLALTALLCWAPAAFAGADLSHLYREMGDLEPPQRQVAYQFVAIQVPQKLSKDIEEAQILSLKAQAAAEDWPQQNLTNRINSSKEIYRRMREGAVTRGRVIIVKAGSKILVDMFNEKIQYGEGKPEPFEHRVTEFFDGARGSTFSWSSDGSSTQGEVRQNPDSAFSYTVHGIFGLLLFDAWSPKRLYGVGQINRVWNQTAEFQRSSRVSPDNDWFHRFVYDLRSHQPLSLDSGSTKTGHAINKGRVIERGTDHQGRPIPKIIRFDKFGHADNLRETTTYSLESSSEVENIYLQMLKRMSPPVNTTIVDKRFGDSSKATYRAAENPKSDAQVAEMIRTGTSAKQENAQAQGLLLTQHRNRDFYPALVAFGLSAALYAFRYQRVAPVSSG